MNVCLLSGRVTKDITKKVTTTNKSVVDFTIAVSKMKEGANFINVQAWNATADYLDKYAKKGNMLVVEGSIEVQTYEKNGATQYKTFILANRVELVGGKAEATESAFGASQEETPSAFTETKEETAFEQKESLAIEEEMPF